MSVSVVPGARNSRGDVERLTTVHLFGVPTIRVPRALGRMAWDREPLRATPGLVFFKLIGTGSGRTFTLRDADHRRWGLVSVWADATALANFERRSPVARAWRRIADERWRADLRVLRSRGRWAGHAPFGEPARGGTADAPVAAITRARLRAATMADFWRSVPPVAAAATAAPGLLFSIGIGESPVGLQGTFSLWASETALRDYAYRDPAHRGAIAATGPRRWYAEELFARFAVLQTTGTVGGREVPAGSGGRPARRLDIHA